MTISLARLGLGTAAACALAVFGSVPAAGSARERFPHCDGRPPTKVASDGGGVLHGTVRADVLLGSASADDLRGRRGRDHHCARRGADVLRDGPGADIARGGRARDRLYAGKGRDHMWGGRARDRFSAADGYRDRIKAGRGNDLANTRDGVRDRVACGPGRDTVRVDNLDVLRNCEVTLTGGMPDFTLSPWSDALWSDPSSFETIQTADIDGDGKDELIGRGPYGIEAYAFDKYGVPTGQWTPLYQGVDPELSDAEGWDDPAYYSTIQAADVNGDERSELLARADDGLHVWEFDPASATWSEIESAQIPAMSDAAGFDNPSWYETIQTADIDGDHLAEVLARESDGLHVWRWNSGTQGFDELSGSALLDDLDDQAGQTDPQFYSTIQTGDIDGDGRQDVLARINSPELGTAGLAWWRFLPGDGWVAQLPLPVGTNPGLSSPSQYSTIQLANLDSDKKEELVVRLSDVHEYELANPFQWNELPALGRFSDAGGWNQEPYYSTIQTADITGGGPAEVLARGPSGLTAFRFNGKSWLQVGPIAGDLSDANGWNAGRYYPTIQTAETGGGGGRAVIARGVTGVQTMELNAGLNSWVSPSVPFPDYSQGEESIAYKAINQHIGGTVNKGFDLRSMYAAGDEQQLGTDWPNGVTSTPQPAGVDNQTWAAVQQQLLAELDNANEVFGWYGDNQYLQGLATQINLAESLDASAKVLAAKTTDELSAKQWDMFVGIMTGIGGLGVVEGAVGDLAVITSSAVGGVASAGLGPDGVDEAMAGVQGELNALEEKLQSDYTTALGGVVAARQEINGDLGLQTAVGELLKTGAWTELSGSATSGDYGAALARAERNYTVAAWQTITPALWLVYKIPADLRDPWCTDPIMACDWQGPDGSWWELALPHQGIALKCFPTDGNSDSWGPCRAVGGDLRAQLYGQTQPGCLTAWAVNCNLGASYSDVFLGQNGWTIKAWTCQRRLAGFKALKCSD
jgi:hypothetical protein